jgi:hypothetical protein
MLTFVNTESDAVALPISENDTGVIFGVYSNWESFLNGAAPIATHHFNGRQNYTAAETFFSAWTKVCRDDSDWSVVTCGPTPEPEVPATVSARQIRLWLLSSGISLSQIDTLINSIADQQQRDYTRVEWEYAPYIERTHPMVAVFAGELGLTEAQIDAGFISAATL